LWTVLGFACFVGALAGGCARVEKPRSLIVITLDTTRADRLGAYGHPEAQTPNLDRLAARGTLYERAYATVPETLPSHASIFTGLYPPSHGVRLNLNYHLPDEAVTLAELLGGRGLRTTAVCAADVLDRRFGLAQGFQIYDAPEIPIAGGDDGEWSAEEITTKALAHMRGWEEQPYFLWAHYYDPHAPFEPLPPFAAPEGAEPESPELYDLEIAFADHWIGVLLDRLDARGGLDDTLIVVVGDHGESLGEHGESYHMLFVYDATIHVPLIVAGPGAPAGRRVADVVSTVEVFSTILASFGVDPPPSSSRMLPGLELGPAAAPQKLLAYSDSMTPPLRFGWSSLEALRTEDWLYIRAPDEELYRLDGSDPGQEINLFRAEPETASELRALLQETVREMPVTGFGDRTGRVATDEEVRALAALGYVAGDENEPPEVAGADPKDLVEVAEAYQLARLARRKGRLDVALDLLDWAATVDPGNMAVVVDLGRTLYRAGRHAAAVDAFSRVRGVVRSVSWLVLVDAAAAHEALGQTAAADAAFADALEECPRPAEAWNRLGRLRVLRGDREEAERAFRTVLELYPEDAFAPRALERLARRAEDAAGGQDQVR
jgi:arylsulfatase A-like enzyme/cytochrome c-type biogenesis protein CcmH/NrfG